MYTLRNLKSAPRKRAKRLGRGNASGSGTSAGRGTKGQRARSGSKGGLKLMGLKATFKAIPKIKGFKSQYPKFLVMNVEQLNQYDANSVVKLADYKILGEGKLTKALTVEAAAFSKSAKDKIEQLGGKAITCGKKS